KLSRLPPRSAVVAFSAEQVYALAEMLRRFKGGAAVVMGALSPATRNAQVAMFQRGEVDYLVATDAIGMGLNMDVTHVAFASLEFTDVRALIRSLEAGSDDPLLRAAPEAIDLNVLKLMAEDPAVPVKRGAQARRLWAVCGLPDFRKVGPMHHTRMVRRLFSY